MVSIQPLSSRQHSISCRWPMWLAEVLDWGVVDWVDRAVKINYNIVYVIDCICIRVSVVKGMCIPWYALRNNALSVHIKRDAHSTCESTFALHWMVMLGNKLWRRMFDATTMHKQQTLQKHIHQMLLCVRWIYGSMTSAVWCADRIRQFVLNAMPSCIFNDHHTLDVFA